MADKAIPTQLIFYYLAVHDDDDGAASLRAELIDPILKEGTLTSSFWENSLNTEIKSYYLVFFDFGLFRDPEGMLKFKEVLLEKIVVAIGRPIDHPVFNNDGILKSLQTISRRLTVEIN